MAEPLKASVFLTIPPPLAAALMESRYCEFIHITLKELRTPLLPAGLRHPLQIRTHFLTVEDSKSKVVE